MKQEVIKSKEQEMQEVYYYRKGICELVRHCKDVEKLMIIRNMLLADADTLDA